MRRKMKFIEFFPKDMRRVIKVLFISHFLHRRVCFFFFLLENMRAREREKALSRNGFFLSECNRLHTLKGFGMKRDEEKIMRWN